MSDIVKELRARSDDLTDDAADEIERLEETLAEEREAAINSIRLITDKHLDRIVTCHEIMSDLYALVNPEDDPGLSAKATDELSDCDCPPKSEYEEMQDRIEELEKELKAVADFSKGSTTVFEE